MIWENHLGIFLHLHLGENMWSASRSDVKGGVGHFYVFSFLHVSEHSEHICFFLLFLVEKINYFHGWGYPPAPPSFAENSAKIINLIPEDSIIQSS